MAYIALLLFLLDVTIPTMSWLGGCVGVAVAILTFFIRRSIKRNDDDIKEIKELAFTLEERLNLEKQLLLAKLQSEKFAVEQALRLIDTKISELHINILNRLGDIKDEFKEFRK